MNESAYIYIYIVTILCFQKLDTTIRFFNRSDYYTLHGSDALFAAQEVFKTTSVCKMIGAGKHYLKTEHLKRKKSLHELFVIFVEEDIF